MKDEKETELDPLGFITIKKKPSKEEIQKHYENFFMNYKDKNIRKNYQEKYDSKEIQHINLQNELCLFSIYKIRENWKENPGSFFEVGVGEGFLLEKARINGCQIHGTDFSKSGIQKFNPQLIKNVEFGDAFEILEKYRNEGKKYDVCIAQNVLEHVLDPKTLMMNLGSILTDNGIILITVPNDFSRIQKRALDLGIVKEKFWVVPPEHLNYFNTENISVFLKNLGFRVIDMYSNTFPIDFFLFHEGSNYIINKKNGKGVHRARLELDLIISESGMDNYHKLCQSLASCNVGRSLTVIIEKNKNSKEILEKNQ